MFISKIEIQNFRNFSSKGITEIFFKEGLNVIIGHNNSGKSNLLKALSLFFDGHTKKLNIDDFNKNISIDTIKEIPPKISISITLDESENEKKHSEDLATVSTWLIKLDKSYQAKLTYEFFLPEQEYKNYKEALNKLESKDIEDYLRIIKHEFIRKYTYKIYSGNPSLKQVVDSESIKKFDFQFLDAIRDVERDLFTGKNTLLKDVLDFFLDFELKKEKVSDEEKEKNKTELEKRRLDFSTKAQEIIRELKTRMAIGKEEMLKYTKGTGASFDNSTPSFDGHLLDTELLSALKLIIEYKTGIRIPATHNGLGYNNLIFMSLLLAKMQINASGEYLGSNAKLYQILAIEEPEAHLHPAMQYKFLKFLKSNQEADVRQLFITTHSPSITAALNLDDIICLHQDDGKTLNVGYPGQVFEKTHDDLKSKAFVQRFLDVTKSEMLFAKKIIFVEGISEQILMPVFANYIEIDIESQHVAVVNIGGRYFNHFLKLFDPDIKGSIRKKVAIITDVDPVKKVKEPKSRFKECFPFELDIDRKKFEYKKCSNTSLTSNNEKENIKFFHSEIGKSKTFEYDLILYNPNCKVLVTPSLNNASEIRVLMSFYKDQKTNTELLSFINDKNLKDKIQEVYSELWNHNEIKKNIIAAYYYSSIKSKGEVALELANSLEHNLTNNDCNFKVPKHIDEAIKWTCQ